MTDNELSTMEAATTVDARGSACPGPLLEAKKGIGKVKVGEVLEIYSNDSGTRTDIPPGRRKWVTPIWVWSKRMGTTSILSKETNRRSVMAANEKSGVTRKKFSFWPLKVAPIRVRIPLGSPIRPTPQTLISSGCGHRFFFRNTFISIVSKKESAASSSCPAAKSVPTTGPTRPSPSDWTGFTKS
jgi:tRNA 2-thiouridine synthesizing protein A